MVHRYQRLIYTVALRAGLGQDVAADVFQATFVRLHEHVHRLREPDRLRAWLVTTAKREALLLRARLIRDVPLTDEQGEATAAGHALNDQADPDPLPETQLAALQQLDLMRRAVERLDAKSQRWVELLFLQEEPMPYTEVAALLGTSVGSIGPTRARLLSKIRALMESEA